MSCSIQVLLYHQRYTLLFHSLDKCTSCKLLWAKASAKCPKCKLDDTWGVGMMNSSRRMAVLLCVQEGGQALLLEREEIQRVVSSCNDFAEAEKRSKLPPMCQ